MYVSDFDSTCAFRLVGLDSAVFLGLCTSLQVLSTSWFVHSSFDFILFLQSAMWKTTDGRLWHSLIRLRTFNLSTAPYYVESK